MGKAQVKVEAKETTKMVVLSLFTLSLNLSLFDITRYACMQESTSYQQRWPARYTAFFTSR